MQPQQRPRRQGSGRQAAVFRSAPGSQRGGGKEARAWEAGVQVAEGAACHLGHAVDAAVCRGVEVGKAA